MTMNRRKLRRHLGNFPIYGCRLGWDLDANGIAAYIAGRVVRPARDWIYSGYKYPERGEVWTVNVIDFDPETNTVYVIPSERYEKQKPPKWIGKVEAGPDVIDGEGGE